MYRALQDYPLAVSHPKILKSYLLTESVYPACFCEDSRNKTWTLLVFSKSQLSSVHYSHGAWSLWSLSIPRGSAFSCFSSDTCGLPDDLLASEFAVSLMELLNHHGADVSLGLAMCHVAFCNGLVLLFSTAYIKNI